jgi:hypothetical protein
LPERYAHGFYPVWDMLYVRGWRTLFLAVSASEQMIVSFYFDDPLLFTVPAEPFLPYILVKITQFRSYALEISHLRPLLILRDIALKHPASH